MSDPFYKSRNSHEPYSRGQESHADAPAGGGGPGRFKATSPHGLDAHDTAFTIPVARSEAPTGFSGRLRALNDMPTSLPARQLAPAPWLAAQSGSEKLLEAATLALPLLPAEMRDKVAAMLSPEAIATLAVIAAAWGGSHYIGIGFAADLALGGLAVYMLGAEAVTITQDLYSYYSIATEAKSKDDLQRAAVPFARAISALGVDVLAAIVAKRVFKKAGQKIEEAKAPKVAEAKKSTVQEKAPAVVIRTAAEERELITKLSNEGKLAEARKILEPYVKEGNWNAVIERLDVSSPKDKAVFWSGNKGAAQSYANEMGGVCLETTPGGRVIDGWNDPALPKLQWKEGGKELWGKASVKYSEGAQGEVHVLQTSAKAAQGGGDTWKGRELPVLEKKEAMGTVRINDPIIVPDK